MTSILTKRKAFAPTLQSFGQLEELDLIWFHVLRGAFLSSKFELNLPTLQSIQLNEVTGIVKLILNAPRLQKVKVEACSASSRLIFVHDESV